MLDTLLNLWKTVGPFRWAVVFCLLAAVASMVSGSGGCRGGPIPRPCVGERGDVIGRWDQQGLKPASSAVVVEFNADGSFVPNVKRAGSGPEIEYAIDDRQLSFFRQVHGGNSSLLVQRGQIRWLSGCEFLYKVSLDTSGVNRVGWTYRFRRR
jgi:hypothetical protein